MEVNVKIDSSIIEKMEEVGESYDRIIELLEENPNKTQEVKEILEKTLGELTSITKKDLFIIH